MKILLLSNPDSIHTKRWVSALSERGITIFLFGLNAPDNLGYYKKIPNVSLYAADFVISEKTSRKTGAIGKYRYLFALKELKRCIREFQPDILHAHYVSSYGLIGALTKFHPFIVSVWGSDIYDFPNVSFLHKKIIKYSLSKADKILSTSHVMVKEIEKYTDKSIGVTPFGVDVDVFKKQPDRKEPNIFVIGNVKALYPKYGIDVLIKAFKIVKDSNPNKNIRMEIIGEGVDKEKLKTLASDLNITDEVCFRGNVENHLLPEWYNSFSVSVSVSNSESFGVVAIEAMACECPVVVSDADGFTEVVVNNETGIIVPKKNPVATAAAIQMFIDNPNLREVFGKNGRIRVNEMYDWNKNVDTMQSIYDNIINKNNDK